VSETLRHRKSRVNVKLCPCYPFRTRQIQETLRLFQNPVGFRAQLSQANVAPSFERKP
jgi:hypothetical protein